VIPDQPTDEATAAVTNGTTTVQGRRLSSGKTATDKAELERLLNADYSIKQYDASSFRMTWKDEPVQSTEKQLLPYFTLDGNRYLPYGISQSNTTNAVYFYFDVNDGEPGPLRLRVQYYADDPINYDELVFTIDGFDYVFFPDSPQRGTASGRMYWENSDDVMRHNDRDLVYALAHAHWMMLKLKGTDGVSHVKMISDSQRQDFSRALQLYRLLGGTLN